MTEPQLDPLTLVYAALWDCLEVSTSFSALVKPGNRVRYDSRGRAPDKEEITTADTPLVRVVPTGATPQVEWTSNSSKLVLEFAIQILTLEQRLDRGLYPVVWELYCAMSRWWETLKTLTWQGQTFVVYGVPKSVQTTAAASEASSQQQAGWLDVWTYEVFCNFSTAVLRTAAGAS